MGNIFTTLITQPITNLLIGIYQLLSALSAPYALGFAIILLTIVIRFILYPLMATQLRSAKKMQEVGPEVSKLRDQYKNNPQRLQAETMALYKKYGINPVAGCLPVLIQIPVLFGLYNVLNHLVGATTVQQINELVYIDALKLERVWNNEFFGIPLGQTPAALFGSLGVAIVIIPLLTGVSQFIQSKMMLPATPVQKDEKKTQPDFATAFQTQSLYIFPVMIGFFSFQFPVGLSLYWITFTIFGIIQQYLTSGWGGLTPLFTKQMLEAPVSEQKTTPKSMRSQSKKKRK